MTKPILAGVTVVAAHKPGTSPLYDTLVIIHVVCALLGFGSVAMSGVYGFMSKRIGHDPLTLAAELRDAKRYFSAPGWIETLTLGVPVFGIAALVVKPHGGGAGQLWAMIALGVWAVATVLLLGVVRPAESVIRRLVAAEEPADLDVDELRRAAGRLGWGAALMDVGFVVALGLMIVQPHA